MKDTSPYERFCEGEGEWHLVYTIGKKIFPYKATTTKDTSK